MTHPPEPLHPTAARYQQVLRDHGLDSEVRMLPGSARTAAEAAASIGVEVGQIVKSLVFLRDGAPVMVLCAGDRTVGTERLQLTRAAAETVRSVTGYAIGGVPPVGHAVPTLFDVSLRRFETVWAAAGHPHAVFPVTPDALFGALAAPEAVEL